MKLKLSIVAASLLVGVGSLAQTYDLKSGWNLVGSMENSVSASKFSDANSVWKYTAEDGWSASSPNGTLTNALQAAGLLTSDLTLNAGDGFWINSKEGNGTITNGTTPVDTTVSLVSGWQLITLKNNSSISVADVFNQEAVTTVWKYTDASWKAYSPNTTLMNTIKAANITELTTINPGEGFWVNASGTQSVLTTPPSISAAYALVEKNNAIPLADAKVYKLNTDMSLTQVAVTNEAGTFDMNLLSDGDKVVVVKNGYAPAYGKVSNGQVQLMSQAMSTLDIPFTQIESDSQQKPSSKVLNSGDGTVQIIVNSMTLNQDVTVAVSTFISPSSAPALNDVDVNGTTVTSDEMLIIGGAHITAQDSDGETLLSVDGTFDATVKQSSILSDLDIILNGQNEIPSSDFEKLAADTKAQLDQAITDDQIALYTLVFKNGEWQYAGTAKIAEYTKLYKQTEYKKYRLETGDGVSLDTLDTFAFVMKMNALKGDLTINVKEGGFKMFDGSIVTKADSNDTTDLEWVGENIVSASVFGDDSVISPVTSTNSDGNVTMSYKVPFVNPYATLSIKKEGYYDATVTCTMSANGAECPTVTMYKIPDTASIEGYVYDNVTKDGIDSSLVTLVNPEVLSADKIVSSVDENGTAMVEVGYLPNITYTWTAMKDDANITIKTGSAESDATLSESEIYTVIVDGYNDGTPPSGYPANPAGNWTLTVKAVHSFTGGKTMTEQAFGSFNLDLNIEKLASVISGALNEGSVSYYDDAYYAVNLPALYAASVYGGVQTGFMYKIGGQDESFAWESFLLGAGGNDANGDLLSDDMNISGQPVTCIDDKDAYDTEQCWYDISGQKLEYKKSFFPAGYLISYVADNFDKLLTEDPASPGENFLTSGFTIKTRYKGVVTALENMIDVDSPVYGTGDYNATVRASSNIDMTGGFSAVKDVLDVPSIDLVGESATAYLRQVTTDTDGSYQINLIPTELSGDLIVFAKAEGYKFESDANLDVKLVDDLETGYVSKYDLYLNPITTDVNTSEPTPVATTFDGWTIESCDTYSNTSVNWNKLTSADITVTGYAASSSVYDDATLSLLADVVDSTTGYLWFGYTGTGTFSDTTSNYSNGKVCGKVISPSIDLANYAFPTLDFKTWFEVESVDIAKGMYDQMEVGFIPSANATLYAIDGSSYDVVADQYYKLDLLNPDYEPAVQSGSVPYSSAGVDAAPKWLDVTLPVEQLAGQTVQFVFTFNSKDSLYNGFRGWGVDGVSIKESMTDNIENPPTIPNIDDTGTAFEGLAKVLPETAR